MATRNRVIYQSEALYVGQPEGDGFHYKAVHQDATDTEYALVGDPSTADEKCVIDTDNWTLISKPSDSVSAWSSSETYNPENYDSDVKADRVKLEGTLQGIEKTWYFEAIATNNNKNPMRSLKDVSGTSDDLDKWEFHPGVKQLHRVQSANYSFSINRQDVNQFGQLSRIDSVAIDPPTVSLDFSYYLRNGLNEKLLGLNIDTKDNLDLGAALNFVKTDKQEEDSSGRNFFILTTPQGTDAVSNPLWDTVDAADQPGTGVDVPAVKASGTISINATGGFGNLSGAVVSIGDSDLTEGSDWAQDGTNDGTATSLASAIDGLSDFTASASGADITVTATVGGTAGNVNVVLGGPYAQIADLITAPAALVGGAAAIPGGSKQSPAAPASTIALGNGFITQYTAEAAVGGMPTASLTVEGLNLKSDAGFHNIDVPAVNNERGTPVNGVTYTLPKPVSGVLDDGNTTDDLEAGFSCLRPGDIEMHLGAMVDGAGSAGLMTPLPHGAPPTDHTTASCHVQSFSIDVPMSRTPIQRLGTPWAYTRPLDFPLTISVSVSAIVADLKKGNVADMLFDFENHDLHFILREPTPDGNGPVAMAYYIRGAQLEGESFSSSIGDNKTVDITFTCQVGGANDKTRGLMVAGSRGAVMGQRSNESKIGDEVSCLEEFDPFKSASRTQNNF